MRIVTVRAKWETIHEVEIEDDVQDIETAAIDQIDSSNAALVDWDVKEKI